MKSLKKTLVLLVVFSMILSAVMPAFAATDVYGLDCEEEVARLEALKVVSGYEDGTFKPENTVTRAEMAVILCKMVGQNEVVTEENKNVPSKFTDVAVGEWYTGYINVAAGKGLLSGFPDGTFRPNEQLTMNQVLTLCVNALGRGEYVSEMGTWPANYIAEATKLGLLDGVKTSDANRGNVAMIVWNTIVAPAVWDVDSTEFEGSINLGDSERSLLSIYFRDYMYEGTLKEELAVTVEKTPSMVKDLGDRQVAFDNSTWEIADVAFKTGAPRRNAEISTYVDNSGDTLDGLLVAYVPENVWADLDSLYGKELTVIFGDDNEVAYIAVTNDEVIDNEFVTKYDDEEITIAGTKYKFVDTAAVYVNNIPMTSAQPSAKEYDTVFTAEDTGILDTLGQTEGEAFTKNVKANIVLNAKGKITRLDLYVSGNFEDYLTKEFVVGKIRNNKIYAHNNTTLIYDYSNEDLEEEDLARVYVDNKKASLEDIEVGDVVTVYYEEGNFASTTEVLTIYVARNTVNGEISKVIDELVIRMDGEKYLPSSSTPLLTEEELKEASTVADVVDYAEETATLYLNIYGEYVLVAADEVVTDYQFAILNYVYPEVKENVENDDFTVYSQNIKFFMPDGSKATYTLVYDSADYEDATGDEVGFVEVPENGLVDETTWERNALIAFAANADNEIKTEDIINLTLGETINEVECTEVEGYELIPSQDDTKANYDDMRIFVDDDTYRFKDASVIMNANNGKPQIATWKKLVGDSEQDVTVGEGWTIICKETEKTVKYIYLNKPGIADLSGKYAVVLETNYTGRIDGKKYTDLNKLFTEEDETVEYSTGEATVTKDTVVSFGTSGNKIKDDIQVFVDLAKLAKLKLTDPMTNAALLDKAIAGTAATYKHGATCTKEIPGSPADAECTGCERVLDEAAVLAATKEAYTVNFIDGAYIEYVELEGVKHVADVKVDIDEVVVLDVTGYKADGEWTPVVRSYSDIKEGDLVAAFDFDGVKKEYKLLVIFAD